MSGSEAMVNTSLLIVVARRWTLIAATATVLALLPVSMLSAQRRPLPPLPGEREPVLAPLPGSTFPGENPRNAVCLDTGPLLEGLLARGVGVGVLGEHTFGSLFSTQAAVAWEWAADRDPADGYRRHILSLTAGMKLSLLRTAVNGPFLGLRGGSSLVWFFWHDQRLFMVWPEFSLELGWKFSLGQDARGLCLEPYGGYKTVFAGAESQGLPMARYGGLVAGVRVGISF